jgi:hypothetical protein
MTQRAANAYIKAKLKGGPNPIPDFLTENVIAATIGFTLGRSERWVNFETQAGADAFEQVFFKSLVVPSAPKETPRFRLNLRPPRPGDQARLNAAVSAMNLEVGVELRSAGWTVYCHTAADATGLGNRLCEQVR